jgi:YVTN family beta-propeller protein
VYDNVMVYASAFTENRVAVIDPIRKAAVASIPVGAGPRGSVFATRSSSIYVANSQSDNVSVMNANPADPKRNTVVATVDVGSWPISVGYYEALDKIYVVNLNSNTISVIRVSDNVAIASNSGRLYVSGGNVAVPPPTALQVVDTTPGHNYPIVASLPLHTSLGAIAINRTESRAYITENGTWDDGTDQGVNVVNLMTNKSITHIPVQKSYEVEVDPNGQVYASTEQGNSLAIVNLVTNSITATIPVSGDVYGLAVSYVRHAG